MPRFSTIISLEELKSKIEADEDLLYVAKIEQDMSKINFDLENFTDDKDGFAVGGEENSLVGYNTLENGFSFQGCLAGGDWEEPLFFIIYWDGKQLRAYVPEDGNVYNHNSKTAFGSEAEGLNGKDLDTFMNADISENLFLEFEDPESLPEWAKKYIDNDHKEFDWVSIRNDIINRIKIK